jgi:hypothetical protein
MQHFNNQGLNLDYYPDFLPKEIADNLFDYLIVLFENQARANIIYGNAGMIYNLTYFGNSHSIEVLAWESCPLLLPVKNLVELTTKEKFNCCTIHYYGDGSQGIGAHRDKEIVSGSICGLSLGTIRELSFEQINSKNKVLNLALNPGSLYVMKDPTNRNFLHSIVKNYKIKKSRISITFRNVMN